MKRMAAGAPYTIVMEWKGGGSYRVKKDQKAVQNTKKKKSGPERKHIKVE